MTAPVPPPTIARDVLPANGQAPQALTLLSAGDIRTALPMLEAVEAMKAAYASLAAGHAVAPQRMALDVSPVSGSTLLMGAYVPGEGLGAKIVSVFPRNREHWRPIVTGIVVLLDGNTGVPIALVDGTALTAWRTGAASGAATDLLARGNARVAGLFGCGAQARTQVLALDAVRHLELIRVYGLTPANVDRFIAEMQPLVRARLLRAASPRETIAEADVICTATTASTPVFDGRDVRPGLHINAIGSFTPEMQEVDAVAIAAARVFVDSREAALAEAGDLLKATALGSTRPEDWTSLGEVVAGLKPGRRSGQEVTYFKSVGLAIQDVIAATRALKAAGRMGLGKSIAL